MLFANAFTDTDIQYILSSSELKENILLNNNGSPKKFEAEYKSPDLTAVQLDDKTVYFNDEEENTVFVINAPYMEDANGKCSDGVTLKIAKSNGNKTVITTTLDEQWLNDSDRAYPVTVDPIFVTSQDWPNTSNVDYCQSAYISSKYPNTSYGRGGTSYEGSLYVGKESGRNKTRSYIKYTSLPALDKCDKVVDARINLYKVVSNYVTVDLYRVTSSWNQSDVTWNNCPSVDTSKKCDYKRFVTSEKATWVSWEITDLVRGWYSGEYENHGIMMKTESETSSDTYKRARFYSTSYTTISTVRPCLSISYRNMSGYEDYYSYTSVDAGRSGAVSVNNYNGALTYSQYLTASTGGTRMPVSLSLVYNSNKSAQKYSSLGAGMQTNYHIFIADNPHLTSSSSTEEKKYKYYLNDADGTAHYFYFESLSDTTAKDEDGLGYKLTVTSSTSSTSLTNTKYTVEDKDKNKMYFNGYGYLLKIEDSNGNYSSVNYYKPSGSTVPLIDTITDGAGRTYTFTYDSTDYKHISDIIDPASRVVYFYYDDNKLTTLEYFDGKKVNIAWNDNNSISSISGINNTVNISYEGNSTERVNSIESKKSSTTLSSFDFEYKQNETRVTDYMNRSYTYQFNDFGQTTGIVSELNGQAQFFKYTPGNSTSGNANKLLSESKIQSSTVNYIKNPSVSGGIADYSVSFSENDIGSITYDSSVGHLSNGSIKISKTHGGNDGYGQVLARQTLTLPAGEYTFSAYVKTDGNVNSTGAHISVSDSSSNGCIDRINLTDGWERHSVQINHATSGALTVEMGFASNAVGTIWFDDLQLEKGIGESGYNMLENSAFADGKSSWTTTVGSSGSADVVSLPNNELFGMSNALRLTDDVTAKNTLCSQTIQTSGAKGDVFSVGAWAKAQSSPIDNGTKTGDTCIPAFKLKIEFLNGNNSVVSTEDQNFNPDVDTWQFNSFCAIAGGEYTSVKVSVVYDNNINSMYTTGVYCCKEDYGQTYTYDKDGNVVSSVDLASTKSSFAYKGNQMSKLLNPSGSSYLYSYDSSNNNLLYANSSDGQQYSFTYDSNGNVTSATVEQSKPATVIESGKTYVLRNAYSGNALDTDAQSSSSNKSIINYHYEPNRKNQQWIVTAVDEENGIYSLKSVFKNTFLSVADTKVGTKFTLASSVSSNKQKYKLQLNEFNGTFTIMTNVGSGSKCVDGQPGDSTDTTDESAISQQTYVADDQGQQWYFYPLVDSSDKKIVTSATYDSASGDYKGGNYLTSSTDALGNTTTYNYNTDRGTLTSTTDAKNNSLGYVYDSNNRVTLIRKSDSNGSTDCISYQYANDRLDKITAFNDLVYDFTYDDFGNTTRTRVGNGTDFYTLSSNSYDSYGRLSRMTYGNGQYVDYSYDSLDRITEKKYNGNSSRKATYKYNSKGQLSLFTDFFANEITKYTYDLSGRLVKTGVSTYSAGVDTEHVKSTVSYRYDDKTNYLTGITHISDALGTSKLDYTYGNIASGQMPDQIYGVKWNDVTKKTYAYDGFGRITTETVKPVNSSTRVLQNTYTYKNLSDNKTTAVVSGMNNTAGNTFYTYDANGNITETRHCDSNLATLYYTSTYQYDSLNQLTSYLDGRNDKSYTFSYDDNGNITAYKVNGSNAKTFGYTNSTWGDLLTSYNGNTIVYDQIGNPLTYKNGESFTWENGRQLTFITHGDEMNIYNYNADGKRTSKFTYAGTTSFTYAGDILAGQSTDGNVLAWIYDNNGKYIGFTYNGSEYYYIYNLQGDVEAIADATGTIIARYIYGPWGTVDAVTDNAGNDISGNADNIANINPIRYRGYYYDTETGFYYLNSRYYDPEICRFINADGYVSTGQGLLSHNMFAYCENNPINRADPSGQFWGIAIGVALFVGIVASFSGCSSNNKSSSKPKPYSNQANCYAYAMKLENDPRTGLPFQQKPQPGEFSGNALTARDLRGNSATVKSNINKKVSADAKVLKLNYTEVSSADYVAKPGNWVVALVYATDGSDYHWYRRNDDGTWSHKPGSTPVISWDASGNTITDPATCDRGIYDGFLGYYEVGPN